MCGIVGVLQWDSDGVRKKQSLQMIEPLVHRGPDFQDSYTSENYSTAHSRLAIIDLSHNAGQPMTTSDGRYTISFNGEIYNYLDLKEKYLKNHILRTNSDTEVLLELLALKGIGTFNLLRGMFAIALWDNEMNELLLARDPFGKKPLYYFSNKNIFIFGSEVKALLAHPDIQGKIDQKDLTKFFLYEYVPGSDSGFQHIKQIPAGSFATVSNGEIKLQQFWQPKFLSKNSMSEKEATRKLDQLLGTAVERRLIADVPVGLLLSGGLDSTAIGWYMNKISDQALHSFSISFNEASFDESSFASQAAHSLNMTHHETLFTIDHFHKAVREIVPMMDIPFADASLLPTHLVCQQAKKHITVALDGDGSDELFGGYGIFQAAEMANLLPRLSPTLSKFVNNIGQSIPTKFSNFSWDFKVKSFLRGLQYPMAIRNQIWLGSFSDYELKLLLTAKWSKNTKNLFEDIEDLDTEINQLETIDAISLLSIKQYLFGDILVKLDRASMFNSLEARTPFLDVDLAEFAMKLPNRFKKNKYLLKKIMQGRIPEEIINRPKKGFGIPLGHWLRGPLYKWACDILEPEKLNFDGILQPTYVSKLLKEHKRGQADHRKKLWTLISFQLWYDHWIKKPH